MINENGRETTKINVGGNDFTVHTTKFDASPDANAEDLFKDFRAEIIKIAPYDDAEYFWAIVGSGKIKYIKDGKTQSIEYYLNADDSGLENGAWVNMIIEQVCIKLNKLNKNIKSKIDTMT